MSQAAIDALRPFPPLLHRLAGEEKDDNTTFQSVFQTLPAMIQAYVKLSTNIVDGKVILSNDDNEHIKAESARFQKFHLSLSASASASVNAASLQEYKTTATEMQLHVVRMLNTLKSFLYSSLTAPAKAKLKGMIPDTHTRDFWVGYIGGEREQVSIAELSRALIVCLAAEYGYVSTDLQTYLPALLSLALHGRIVDEVQGLDFAEPLPSASQQHTASSSLLSRSPSNVQWTAASGPSQSLALIRAVSDVTVSSTSPSDTPPLDRQDSAQSQVPSDSSSASSASSASVLSRPPNSSLSSSPSSSSSSLPSPSSTVSAIPKPTVMAGNADDKEVKEKEVKEKEVKEKEVKEKEVKDKESTPSAVSSAASAAVSIQSFQILCHRFGSFGALPLRLASVCRCTSPPTFLPWFTPQLSDTEYKRSKTKEWRVRYSTREPTFVWMYYSKGNLKQQILVNKPSLLEGYFLKDEDVGYEFLPELLDGQKAGVDNCAAVEFDLTEWRLRIRSSKYSSKTEKRTPLDCVACMATDREVMFTTCQHFVCCRRCVNQLLSMARQRKNPVLPQCPTCRVEFDFDDVVDVKLI